MLFDFNIDILPEPVEYNDYDYVDDIEFDNDNLIEGNIILKTSCIYTDIQALKEAVNP